MRRLVLGQGGDLNKSTGQRPGERSWKQSRIKSLRRRVSWPAQLPTRGPAANGSEATATTEMPNLSYDEMDKLTPCRVCGSHRYWFDGKVWQCWNCVSPPSADMIPVDLHARVN